MIVCHPCNFFFFFNDTATTEIYTLSLHDALPISVAFSTRSTSKSTSGGTRSSRSSRRGSTPTAAKSRGRARFPTRCSRSEEHTSELQSPCNLVCRLLLEKKKNNTIVARLNWLVQ